MSDAATHENQHLAAAVDGLLRDAVASLAAAVENFPRTAKASDATLACWASDAADLATKARTLAGSIGGIAPPARARKAFEKPKKLRLAEEAK